MLTVLLGISDQVRNQMKNVEKADRTHWLGPKGFDDVQIQASNICQKSVMNGLIKSEMKTL